MNKALQELARQSEYRLDNERKVVYGNLHGFYIILTEQTQKEINLMFTVKSEEENDNKQEITNFLNSLKSGNSNITYQSVNGHKINLYIKAYKTDESEVIKKIIEQIADFLQTLKMKDCCEYCGDIEEIGVSSINGTIGVLCNTCLHKLKNTIGEHPKSNLPLGILGIVLGSLIGVAVWVIIYQLGFIAGIAGFLTFYCAYKGYQKLGKREDMLGIIISILVSIIMLVAAEFICLLIELLKQYGMYDYNLMDCISMLPTFLAIPEIYSAILKEMAMGYVLMIVATVSSIKKCIAQVNKPTEALRL